jgi:hypothetical protein
LTTTYDVDIDPWVTIIDEIVFMELLIQPRNFLLLEVFILLLKNHFLVSLNSQGMFYSAVNGLIILFSYSFIS